MPTPSLFPTLVHFPDHQDPVQSLPLLPRTSSATTGLRPIRWLLWLAGTQLAGAPCAPTERRQPHCRGRPCCDASSSRLRVVSVRWHDAVAKACVYV